MSLPPIASLEIGTGKVRVLVGEMRPGDGALMVTGMGECPSRGVRKGEVIHLENAIACVKSALHTAEENSGVSIAQVHLAISGGHLGSLVNRGTHPIPQGEVFQEDTERVMALARAVNLPPDREILHTICQLFYLDQNPEGVVAPEGMECAQLAGDVLILHGIRTRLRTLVRVVRSLQVDVQDVAFSGLCAALAVLTPEDKERGVALIDLGAGTTDYVVYARNAIAMAGAFGVGGDHVTNDIARGFCIATMDAEQLKEQMGSALLDNTTKGQKIALPAAAPGAPARSARLADLQTIIHLRMEETFNLIKNQLQQQKLLHELGGGIVLTGGGALMRHVDKLAEKVFGLPCQIGRPHDVSGLSVASEGPVYATGVGMLRYGVKTISKTVAEKPGLFGMIRQAFKR